MESREDFDEADLRCPLSQQIFLDPVKIPVGFVRQPDGTIVVNQYVTVERQVIEKWINQEGKNPFSREPLAIGQLIPDEEMRKKVSEFLEKNPDKKDSQYILEIPSTTNQPQDASSQAPRPSEPTEDDWLAIRRAQAAPQPAQAHGLFPQINRSAQQRMTAVWGRQPLVRWETEGFLAYHVQESYSNIFYSITIRRENETGNYTIQLRSGANQYHLMTDALEAQGINERDQHPNDEFLLPDIPGDLLMPILDRVLAAIESVETPIVVRREEDRSAPGGSLRDDITNVITPGLENRLRR